MTGKFVSGEIEKSIIVDNSVSNKRIAKNTIFLYGRMAVTIVINLYTIKLLLNTLGTDNYGIYTLMGSIVTMLSFLSNSMVGSTQRFLAYEIGKGDEEGCNKVFSVSLSIHIWLALIVFVIAETAGLWFVNNHVDLPPDKIVGSNWMYQSVVISFILTVLSVPYNASIVAYERMDAFGWFGVLEVVLKLVIVYLTAWLPFDRLISYAVLLCISSFIMRVLYGVFCNRHFTTCKFKKYKDGKLAKEMINFAKWTFVGMFGFAIRSSGINVVMNNMLGLVVIAARGVTVAIGNAVNGFASSFTMALNPGIIKHYAADKIGEMMNLMFKGAKYALLLMSMVVVPFAIACQLVFELWLADKVSEYTVGFMRLTLVLSTVECVVSPITTSLQATGNIRLFQILISIIMTANLPIAWLLLKITPDPYLVYYTLIGTSIIAVATRLMLLHSMIKFSYWGFVSTVYLRTLPVILISSLAGYYIFRAMPWNIWGLIAFVIIFLIMYLGLTATISLDKSERVFVLDKVKTITQKITGR